MNVQDITIGMRVIMARRSYDEDIVGGEVLSLDRRTVPGETQIIVEWDDGRRGRFDPAQLERV